MKRMQSGFTLVEMIFVIIIIGILGAVAVPKFKYLKQNAEIANVLQVVRDLNGSGGTSSYLNALELRGIPASDINITNLYKFSSGSWQISSDNKDANYTSRDKKLVLQLHLNIDGTVDGNISKCDPPYDTLLQKRGMSCGSSSQGFVINLDEG